jgi:hypothetical protein
MTASTPHSGSITRNSDRDGDRSLVTARELSNALSARRRCPPKTEFGPLASRPRSDGRALIPSQPRPRALPQFIMFLCACSVTRFLCACVLAQPGRFHACVSALRVIQSGAPLSATLATWLTAPAPQDRSPARPDHPNPRKAGAPGLTKTGLKQVAAHLSESVKV